MQNPTDRDDVRYVYDGVIKQRWSAIPCQSFPLRREHREPPCGIYAVTVPPETGLRDDLCFQHLKQQRGGEELALRWAEGFVRVAEETGKLYGLNLDFGEFRPRPPSNRLVFPDDLRIEQVYLSYTRFTDCVLHRVHLGAIGSVIGARFVNCDLSHATIAVSDFIDVHFHGCDLSHSSWLAETMLFKDGSLTDVTFQESALRDALFYNVTAKNVNFAARAVQRLTIHGGVWRDVRFADDMVADSLWIQAPVVIEACVLPRQFEPAVAQWRRKNLVVERGPHAITFRPPASLPIDLSTAPIADAASQHAAVRDDASDNEPSSPHPEQAGPAQERWIPKRRSPIKDVSPTFASALRYLEAAVASAALSVIILIVLVSFRLRGQILICAVVFSCSFVYLCVRPTPRESDLEEFGAQ